MKQIILMVLFSLALQAERCEMSFAMSGVYVYETKEGMVIDPNKYKEVTHKVSRECEVKAKLAVFELWNTEQPDDNTPKIFLIKADGSITNISDRILSTPTSTPPKENKMYMPMCKSKGEDIALTPDISIHTRCAYRYNDILAYDTAEGIVVNFDTRYSKVRMLQEMSENQCCSMDIHTAIKKAKKKWYETDHTKYLVTPSGIKSVQQLVGHRPATKKWLRNAMRETIEYDATSKVPVNPMPNTAPLLNRVPVKHEVARNNITPIKLAKGRRPHTFDSLNNPFLKVVQMEVTITSVVDNVIIEKIVINRGNCTPNNNHYKLINGKLQNINLLPKRLLYGQIVKIDASANCIISEVQVFTNQGSYTFTWD